MIPEIILLAAACLVTLLGLSSKDALRKLTQSLAVLALLAGFLVCGCSIFGSMHEFAAPATLYFNPNYITLLACGIGVLSVLAAWDMPSRSDPSVPDSHLPRRVLRHDALLAGRRCHDGQSQ